MAGWHTWRDYCWIDREVDYRIVYDGPVEDLSVFRQYARGRKDVDIPSVMRVMRAFSMHRGLAKVRVEAMCGEGESLSREEWVGMMDMLLRMVEGEDGKALTENVELWLRDPLECIRELIGNPAFRECMKYAPERHYADRELRERMISEMWTGNWWWTKQVSMQTNKQSERASLLSFH